MSGGSPAVRPLGRAGRGALVGILLAGSILAAADPFSLLFFVSYAAVAGLIVIRRPSNVIGWLLLVIALGFIGTTSRPGADAAALVAGTADPGTFLFAWIGSWAGYASFLCFAALAMVFPSGRLAMGRWRWLAMASLAIGAVLVVITAVAPAFTYNPDGGAFDLVIPIRLALLPSLAIWSLWPTEGSVALFYGLGLLAIAAGSLVVHYRRSAGIVRLQLRWLVSAVVFVFSAVAFGLGMLAVFGDPMGVFVWIPAIIAYPTVPIAIGLAILRYRLYEIDRLISRTIGYALITGVLVAVFAGTVLALQTLLEPLTGENTVAVAASTLIVAALFQPLRRRVQQAVDRRFDRARYDGQRVVDAFAMRLRDEVDLDRLRTALVATADDIVRPVDASIWLRSRETGR